MPITQIDTQDIETEGVTASDLFTGSSGSTLMMSGSTPAWISPIDSVKFISVLNEDWLSASTAGSHQWTVTQAGSFATVSLDTSVVDSSHPGVLSLSTGTTASGRAAVSNNLSSIVFGSSPTNLEMVIYIPVLSVPAQRFNVFCGFGDNIASGSMVDGVIFMYGDEINSGRWRIVASNNSVNTVFDTTTTVNASQWIKLRIEVPDASTANCYVNDSFVGSISGSLPSTAARATGLIAKIQKTVGTTARTLLSDYITLSKSISR